LLFFVLLFEQIILSLLELLFLLLDLSLHLHIDDVKLWSFSRFHRFDLQFPIFNFFIELVLLSSALIIFTLSKLSFTYIVFFIWYFSNNFSSSSFLLFRNGLASVRLELLLQLPLHEVSGHHQYVLVEVLQLLLLHQLAILKYTFPYRIGVRHQPCIRSAGVFLLLATVFLLLPLSFSSLELLLLFLYYNLLLWLCCLLFVAVHIVDPSALNIVIILIELLLQIFCWFFLSLFWSWHVITLQWRKSWLRFMFAYF
jgi:hypothetical protein